MQVSLLTGIMFMLGAVCRLGSLTKLLTPPIISRWAVTCQGVGFGQAVAAVGCQVPAVQGVGFVQALLQLSLSTPP